MAFGSTVTIGVRVIVLVGVTVLVALGVAVLVAVAVRLGVAVGVTLAGGDAVGVAVPVAVRVGVKVRGPAAGLPSVVVKLAVVGLPSRVSVTTSPAFGSLAATSKLIGWPAMTLKTAPSAGVRPMKTGGWFAAVAASRMKKSTPIFDTTVPLVRPSTTTWVE